MANEFKVRKGLIVQGSGSSGDETILDIQGNSGQLFSVTDSLVGALFTVSDISGIPIMEVFSDNFIKMGEFGSDTLIVSGSSVGIGTTSPVEKLDVWGNINLTGVSGQGAVRGGVFGSNLVSFNDGTLDIGFANNSIVSNPITANITFNSLGQEIMRLDGNNGNVGIGTTSPSQLLNVVGSSTGFIEVEETSFGSGLLLGASGGASIISTTGGFGDLRINSTSAIRLSTDGGSTTSLFINSSDNVGIGTTSPSAKLSVAGDVSISTNAHVQGKFLAGEDALPNSDHTLANGGSSAITPSTFAVNTVSGQILTGQTSGETLENGHLVYLRSNGSWYLADADQTATSTSLLGIALKDVTGVGSIDVLIDGVIGIEEDFVTFSNIGEPLYINAAAGKMTNTAPSGTGDVVRVVGHYLGADSTATGVLVAFKPDGTWIEL